MKRNVILIAAIALALCACNKEEKLPRPEDERPGLKEAPACTFNISASLNDPGTKAMSIGESTVTSTFADTDSVYVFIEGQRNEERVVACGFELDYDHYTERKIAPLTLSNINGSTCDLGGALKFYYYKDWWYYEPFTPMMGDIVYLFYNMFGVHSPLPYNDYEITSFRYDTLNGDKDGFTDAGGYRYGANHFDFADAKMKITKVEGDAESGYTLTLVQYADETKSDVSFKNRQSQFRQRLSFTQGPGGEGSTTPTITQLTVSLGNNKTVAQYYPFGTNRNYRYAPLVINNPTMTDGDVYFALMFNEENKGEALTLTAVDDNGNVYTTTKNAPAAGFDNGKYYYGTATLTWTPKLYFATAEDLGKIVGANGELYADADAAVAAGTTAEAMVAYVGSIDGVCAHGLAISLTDIYEYNATYADATGSAIIPSWALYHPITGGTWRLPSEKDWQYMMWGYYTPTPVAAPVGGIKSVLANSGIYYWTSDEVDEISAKGIYYDGSTNASVQTLGKAEYYHVRACLAF